MNNVMKGISLYAMKNRSPAVTLETSFALSLVSCDCPLIFSSIDRPSFSHQCTSGLQQISTRWTSDDWQKHFEQQHDSIISEVTSLCESVSAASSGCCPFGCHVIEEHGHKAPVQSKENNHSRRESGLAQRVMNALKADKDSESAQKLRDPLTGIMRIAHNKQHQVERAEKNLILHLSSCHLSELQFMLSMGHEIVSSLHSSSSCPIHQPNKVALADYDLEEEDKSVMKCDAKDVKVAHILKEHQKDLIVAARYVRSVVESSLGQGHLGSCSLCSEKITSLEWGMQHYAHLHSREIMNKNLKMIKRQMEERSLAAVSCPFSSTSHASSCCVVVKKQHRLYSHLDRDHSSEIRHLAASLAPIGGHRKNKILVDHLKLPIISSAVKDDSVDMEEPEIEHLCLCCAVLSGQNTGLPQISSSLDRAYHDSLPACADHIVNDHKDLLLALTSFTSSIIGETSSPFMSCPLHPCAAGGGGDGFRAVFGGRAELYDHLVTRHVDHLVSILRVALVIVQSSLLNSPSIKCPISSCHEASTFHSGMDLLIHLMRNHGQQLLKHSNHSAMGTRITSSAAGRSTNSPLQQEEFGLLSDAKEAEVDVSFSFTSIKDQEGKMAAAKDEVAVAAALIASKLSAKKREAKETTGDFGLKAEALEHVELI